MDPVKFNFDTSFDAGVGKNHQAEISDLLDKAKSEKENAHQAGFQEGHAQAMAEIESATVAVLERVEVSAIALLNEFNDIRAQICQECAQIAHMVGLQLAENLMLQNPTLEIEKIIEDVFNDLHDIPRLIIRVSPDVATAIGPRIKLLQERAAYNGELIMAEDPSFTPQDIHVEWGEGGIKRDFESIQNTVQECVSRYVTSIAGDEVEYEEVDQ